MAGNKIFQPFYLNNTVPRQYLLNNISNCKLWSSGVVWQIQNFLSSKLHCKPSSTTTTSTVITSITGQTRNLKTFYRLHSEGSCMLKNGKVGRKTTLFSDHKSLLFSFCGRTSYFSTSTSRNKLNLKTKDEYDELDQKQSILVEAENIVVKEDRTSHNSGWLLRLANENGYLSWCRNVYIGTVIAVTVQLQNVIPYHQDVAFLFFFMSGLNLLSGTFSYLYNIIRHHKRMHMSVVTVLYNVVMALAHAFLWTGAVFIYLGYVDEGGDDGIKVL